VVYAHKNETTDVITSKRKKNFRRDSNTPGEIRTRNPSKRYAADIRLTLNG